MPNEGSEEQRLFELKKLAYDLLSKLTLKRCEIDVMYLGVIMKEIRSSMEECKIKSINIGNIVTEICKS